MDTKKIAANLKKRLAESAEALPCETLRLLDIATFFHCRLPEARATYRAELAAAGCPDDVADWMQRLAPADAFRCFFAWRALGADRGADTEQIWRGVFEAVSA